MSSVEISSVEQVIKELNDEFSNYVLKQLMEKILSENIGISITTLLTIVKYGMEIIDQYKLINKGKILPSSQDKKKILINIITIIISNSNMEEEDKKYVYNMINTGLIDNTIEIIIDATKGKIDVNKVDKIAEGCCMNILSCLMMKNKK